MTLRLVAIMGIVLALCMGAFALIANSYHQQVLEEAGQIIEASHVVIELLSDQEELPSTANANKNPLSLQDYRRRFDCCRS